MQAVKRIAAILAILFLAAQFIRPTRSNPPVDPQLDVRAAAQVPPEVAAILKRSCFDCHSNETVWPWYTNITPINWWIVDSHVEHGRSHYNFSEWGKKEAGDRDHLLDEICEEVERGTMPLPSYLIVHRGSQLSDAQRKTVCDWTRAERERLKQTITPAETPSVEGEEHGEEKH